MSSNRIFASGIRQQQGRSANLTGAMLKRSPIFTHVPPQKQQNLTPFANYNCRSSDSLFTSQSQTSLGEQKVNAQWITKIVREELMKWQSQDSSKKQLGTIQAQLNDIKERIAESERSYDKRLQEIKASSKEQLRAETQKMGEEIQSDISSRLRTFFQKANIEMKKDILTSAQQQFLTLNYGDDLQNRLQAFNERIQALNDLIASKNNLSSAELSQKVNSMVMNQQFQPRLIKIQKQLQLFKKGLHQNVNKSKMLQQRITSIDQKRINESSFIALQDKCKVLQSDQCKSSNRIVKLQEQQDKLMQFLSRLRLQVEEQDAQREEFRTQLIQLQKYIRNQPFKSHQIKTYLTDSNNFDTSIIANNSSVVNSSSVVAYQLNKNSSSNNSELSQLRQMKKIETIQSKQSNSDVEWSGMVYQVDSDGYLMDGDCRYLLTESGQMIKLEANQIRSLLQSKMVSIIQR